MGKAPVKVVRTTTKTSFAEWDIFGGRVKNQFSGENKVTERTEPGECLLLCMGMKGVGC